MIHVKYWSKPPDLTSDVLVEVSVDYATRSYGREAANLLTDRGVGEAFKILLYVLN